MKIGTVSTATGLGIHTIRYYAKQGLLRKPDKDNSGHRAYSEKDIDILNWIVCMKNSGMSLSRIKAYTKAFYDDDHDVCITYLEEHLKQLSKQKQDIDHYIEVTTNKITRFRNA